MATVSKVIFQGVLGTSYNNTTVPAGHTYQITHIHFNNYSGLTVTVSADSAPYYVEWFSQRSIGPKETYDWYPRDLVLAAGEALELKASATSSIACTVFGKDIT